MSEAHSANRDHTLIDDEGTQETLIQSHESVESVDDGTCSDDHHQQTCADSGAGSLATAASSAVPATVAADHSRESAVRGDDSSVRVEATIAAERTTGVVPDSQAVTLESEDVSDIDPEFSVEETIAASAFPGTRETPSRTVPLRSDESGGTVEHTLPHDDSTRDDRGSRPEGGKSATPKIGRFEIVKVLGQGAFGTVYLAHDPHLDRKVAIKVAKTGVLSGKQDVDRFMREARSAAQLRHPNIIPVYEFERMSHSSFIAYEFIEGRTLGDLLKEKKKLSCEEAATLIGKLASALDYAHSHGIVHRDMKPENVLIDKDGEPHIADFGLARRDDGDTLRTREGMFMGTPSYMSPEQAGGKAHLADGRSDIWSLGIMLQEMLTGVRPFRGSVTEVLVAVQNQDPPALRTIDRSLPRDLETICQKALTKNPDQRYQRAQDLADELQRWKDGIPILARPISLPNRAWLWAKRNPDVAGLIGAVLATFLVGAVLSTWFGISAVRSENQLREAQADRARSRLVSLESAVPESVPIIIQDLAVHREDILAQLQSRMSESDIAPGPRARLMLAAAILGKGNGPSDSVEQTVFDGIAAQLLESDAAELLMLAKELDFHDYEDRVEPSLWRVGQRELSSGGMRRFRALAALAALDSDAPDWQRVAPDLVAQLLSMNQALYPWLPSLRPVRSELEGPLTAQFLSGSDRHERDLAAAALAELFDDSLETLVALIPSAKPEQLSPLLTALESRADEVVPRLSAQLQSLLDQRRSARENGEPNSAVIANLAASLLHLNAPDRIWPLLAASENEEVRSRLIHAVPPAGVPWKTIESRLAWETDPSVQAALCLMLGEYSEGELLPGERNHIKPKLLDLYATHPHPGVHSAARWTLQRWGMEDDLAQADAALVTAERVPERKWHVDSQGVTFVVFDRPIDFEMGAPPSAPHYQENQQLHRRLIPRTFGISTQEVTMAEFLKSREDHPAGKYLSGAPEMDCPALSLTWIDAAMYCRWLSEQAGIDERNMCYPPLSILEKARTRFDSAILELPDDLLDRTGYRLPTAAEWEYACRGLTRTTWSFGNSEDLLEHYAWYDGNTQDRSMPVGVLKPNHFGLFDMHGNAFEWCQSFYFDTYTDSANTGLVTDGIDSRNAKGSTRELRGGSYLQNVAYSIATAREYMPPSHFDLDLGFRIARTYPAADPSTPAP